MSTIKDDYKGEYMYKSPEEYYDHTPEEREAILQCQIYEYKQAMTLSDNETRSILWSSLGCLQRELKVVQDEINSCP